MTVPNICSKKCVHPAVAFLHKTKTATFCKKVTAFYTIDVISRRDRQDLLQGLRRHPTGFVRCW